MIRPSPDFIFMLTNQDKTVADAEERLQDVFAAGITHIGFKDVGLPFDRLKGMADAIKARGANLYLEVVSLDEESEKKSAEAGLALGIDVLMGGTRPDVVLPMIAGKKIGYYPFPGKVVGHPSKLEGTIEKIVESAKKMAALDGVTGLDLLAYRFDGNVEQLMTEVCKAVDKPICVAGSIDSPDRLASVVTSGAAAFTVGSAAFNGAFSGEMNLVREIEAISAALNKITSDQLASIQKVNAASEFSKFSDLWSPKVGL